MDIEQVKPFIRFARYVEPTEKIAEMPSRAYDARFFFTDEGCGKIEIGKNTVCMNCGDVLIVNSGVKYRMLMPDEFVRYIAFNFDCTQANSDRQSPILPSVRRRFYENEITEKFDVDELCTGDFLHLENVMSVRKNAALIVREYTERRVGYQAKISAVMTEILVDCMRCAQLQKNTAAASIAGVLGYIRRNYALPITNEQIGKEFNFHPNYISRLVKRATGMPLHSYVIHVRLMNAVNLLDSGDCTIGEAARKCGFCDIYHFSAYFKSAMHMSPSEYIKR